MMFNMQPTGYIHTTNNIYLPILKIVIEYTLILFTELIFKCGLLHSLAPQVSTTDSSRGDKNILQEFVRNLCSNSNKHMLDRKTKPNVHDHQIKYRIILTI